ncbi:hypothetical protein D3C76_1664100 [compost metagenome]
MAHGDSVVHTDRVELKRYAAGFADCFFDDFAELLQMHVSWHDIDIRVAHRDKRFAEIFFLHACGPQ